MTDKKATDFSREDYERAVLERRINDCIEYMVRRYSPSRNPDASYLQRHSPGRFESELFSLLRMVQQQATEPMLKQMTSMLSLVPFSPFVYPPAPKEEKKT